MKKESTRVIIDKGQFWGWLVNGDKSNLNCYLYRTGLSWRACMAWHNIGDISGASPVNILHSSEI